MAQKSEVLRKYLASYCMCKHHLVWYVVIQVQLKYPHSFWGCHYICLCFLWFVCRSAVDQADLKEQRSLCPLLAVCFGLFVCFCRVPLSQGQTSVAMVNLESKKLSSPYSSAPLRHLIGWLSCMGLWCGLSAANRAQTERGLLLGGVAWKRVSWIFSLSLLLSHCTHWLHLPLPFLLPVSLSLFFCTSTCAGGIEHMLKNSLNISCCSLVCRALMLCISVCVWCAELFWLRICVCLCKRVCLCLVSRGNIMV